jgi:hypothetical protein
MFTILHEGFVAVSCLIRETGPDTGDMSGPTQQRQPFFCFVTECDIYGLLGRYC